MPEPTAPQALEASPEFFTPITAKCEDGLPGVASTALTALAKAPQLVHPAAARVAAPAETSQGPVRQLRPPSSSSPAVQTRPSALAQQALASHDLQTMAAAAQQSAIDQHLADAHQLAVAQQLADAHQLADAVQAQKSFEQAAVAAAQAEADRLWGVRRASQLAKQEQKQAHAKLADQAMQKQAKRQAARTKLQIQQQQVAAKERRSSQQPTEKPSAALPSDNGGRKESEVRLLSLKEQKKAVKMANKTRKQAGNAEIAKGALAARVARQTAEMRYIMVPAVNGCFFLI